MTVFLYDKSFEGMLSCLFEAYKLKDFPEQLLPINAPLPLFCNHVYTIVTEEEKTNRVWKGIKKKLSVAAVRMITISWLSELPEIDMILFRYLHKVFDSPISIETNFADTDVLQLSHIYKKVNYEGHRLIQFARFQKTADGMFFAPLQPQFNTIPLTIPHFKDRFADQKFLIYDMGRHYGFYYNLKDVSEVTLNDETGKMIDGILKDEVADKDEAKYEQLWQTYFKNIAIRERINPRKQRQDMPVRYWRYLTEMQQ